MHRPELEKILKDRRLAGSCVHQHPTNGLKSGARSSICDAVAVSVFAVSGLRSTLLDVDVYARHRDGAGELHELLGGPIRHAVDPTVLLG